MEEHLFSYENIFRNKDLNIDKEIREKNQKEKRSSVHDSNVSPEDGDQKEESPHAFANNKWINEPEEDSSSCIQSGAADESKKGERDDTSAWGEGRPSEPVEEASTEVISMTHAAHTRGERQDATLHTNSQTKPQYKKKIKNDVSSLFAYSSSDMMMMSPARQPSHDNNEINFWYSGKGATPGGEADGIANGTANGEHHAHDHRLATPLGHKQDGATNVKCNRGEYGRTCGIQDDATCVDAFPAGCNEEKQIRSDGGDIPNWTPQGGSSDLVRDVRSSGRCKNGPSEESGNATALCFGTNGTLFYTRGRKVKFAPLIYIMESGIRAARLSSRTHAGGTTPPSSHTSAKHSNRSGIRDNKLEEQVYAIKEFPGPFSRRNDKVDKKVINFLHGHIKLNEKKYGNNVYEYTQKSCLYKYLLNVMKSPHMLNFNLKDVRVDRSGAKTDGMEKRKNVVSYFLESSRHQGDGLLSRNSYPSGRKSDHPKWSDNWSGDLRVSENNPREESGDHYQNRRDNNSSHIGQKRSLHNKKIVMEEFEITGREKEKRDDYPGVGDMHHHDKDLYQGDDVSWSTSAYCGQVPSFNEDVTWCDTNACDGKKKKKKRVFVHNQQYEFNDVVDPHFIQAFSKMGTKEKITTEDIYLEYYHLCIYNSEKAARICVENNLFKHFFLILKKYNDHKYRLMLSKYISHMNNSMDHDMDMNDGVKNIFRIYNPSVHNRIVKEAFVFLISLLNRESMTFEQNVLIHYWYSFYVLIYHNFLFQFEENELDYEEYKGDICKFFSFLIKQLYVHGRVTESQFLYLQLCGNPCVFKVAAEGDTAATSLESSAVESSAVESSAVEERRESQTREWQTREWQTREWQTREWGRHHFDVFTFQMCEVIEYLNRSNEDNFFYEDLIRHKINYAFTLLELGVLEQAKKYIEIIYYYVDVIRSQKKKNYDLVHMYESLLNQAKYVLPSVRLHNGGTVPTNWTTLKDEDLPEGGIYNYKVISPHKDVQNKGSAVHVGRSAPIEGNRAHNHVGDGATSVPPPNEQISEEKNGSREGGDPYYCVPFYQQPNDNNVARTPFEAKNSNRFNTDHVGSTHQGAITGRISNSVTTNPASPPHKSATLTAHQDEYNERAGNYSPFNFPPTPHSVDANTGQSNMHNHVWNDRMSIPSVANSPYQTNDQNSFLSSYHPPQMVTHGQGPQYNPVERGGIAYQQYNGAYQNEGGQVSYFYRGRESMEEGMRTSHMPDGGNSTSMSSNHISNACDGGYNMNWGGDHGVGGSQYDGGVSSSVSQDNYAYYYNASWHVAYPDGGSFNQATHHALQQGSHQNAYPPSSNNYPAGGSVPYGGGYANPPEQSGKSAPPEQSGKCVPPDQSGKSGPPEVTEKKTQSEKKKQEDEPRAESNMDLINIGKTFISGFFSNIKEKIKKVEQAEEEEEENIFYYDYEKKRWREKGVTSDEEEERERQKMQREMEIKNVAPPPQTENSSQTNKKNPLDIKDVRSRYVDYFN
ncbi:hypothetical protein AK88_02668 [Plasmodium fragile]|uniref:Sec16 Sec23-binding domain-containing protein n=1 Tax=Plasmodium fragile TaxID=5857 RepID=A0A0D9QKS0_PLAFR|nr:uncharacterized protein AK88_02668 [Plasmodium fragile]KJP87640.1 hypothetical protein AK88_02668 [Plasmodium fragile]